MGWCWERHGPCGLSQTFLPRQVCRVVAREFVSYDPGGGLFCDAGLLNLPAHAAKAIQMGLGGRAPAIALLCKASASRSRLPA